MTRAHDLGIRLMGAVLFSCAIAALYEVHRFAATGRDPASGFVYLLAILGLFGASVGTGLMVRAAH